MSASGRDESRPERGLPSAALFRRVDRRKAADLKIEIALRVSARPAASLRPLHHHGVGERYSHEGRSDRLLYR